MATCMGNQAELKVEVCFIGCCRRRWERQWLPCKRIRWRPAPASGTWTGVSRRCAGRSDPALRRRHRHDYVYQRVRLDRSDSVFGLPLLVLIWSTRAWWTLPYRQSDWSDPSGTTFNMQPSTRPRLAQIEIKLNVGYYVALLKWVRPVTRSAPSDPLWLDFRGHSSKEKNTGR